MITLSQIIMALERVDRDPQLNANNVFGRERKSEALKHVADQLYRLADQTRKGQK